MCTHPQLRLDSDVPARWEPALRALCDELVRLPDLDPFASLQLRATDAEIVLRVTLPDGREATRRVQSSAALEETVEALMVKPRADSPATLGARPTDTPIAAGMRGVPARGLTLTMSGALTGRIARAPTYLSWGVELNAGLYLERWLLVLSLRWDELSRTTSSLESDDVGAGFSVARRVIEKPGWALSLGGAATLLMQTQSADVRGAMRPRSASDLRLGLLARLLIGDGSLRGLIAWNFELSPLRLRRAASLYEPLPSWGMGLALGCAWESP